MDCERRWTRRQLLDAGARMLEEAGVEAPRRVVLWMMEDVLARGRAHLLAHADEVTPEEHVRRLQAMLMRRKRGEPLQYILGHTSFYGLDLAVTPAVLVPRPETEVVVEAALRALADRPAPRVLDVGTGSGCIALAIKQARPDAAVYACDVSAGALGVATRNAERHGLVAHFFQADVLSDAFDREAPSSLDLLVSNPPYVAEEEAAELPAEVCEHEPHAALFAGSDPLRFYRVITERAVRLLREEGRLVFEIHAHRGEEVASLLEEHAFDDVEVKEDLAGRPRIVLGWHRPDT